MHGITRAAITKAQAGRWSSGFWSGFASSAFAAPKNLEMANGTAMMAVVGGTVSVISGGKFANGAVSGAFVHLFNNYGREDYIVKKQLTGDTTWRERQESAMDMFNNSSFAAEAVAARQAAKGNLFGAGIAYGASKIFTVMKYLVSPDPVDDDIIYEVFPKIIQPKKAY